MAVWVLFVFIGNGWGGGDLKEISTAFPTEQACRAAGKIMYDHISHVTSFVCLPKGEQSK